MTVQLTIGQVSQFLQLSKMGLLGINITDFGALFSKVRDFLRPLNQLTPELDAQLTLAETELRKNPGLFEIGKAETAARIDALIAKYPPNTPLGQIPEFNAGGGTGASAGPFGVSVGPGGIDVATIAAAFRDISAQFNASTGEITFNGLGVSTKFTGIERLKLNDGTLYLDLNGVAGQAYRIYEAAFDRKPDNAGLKYWIDNLDRNLTLKQTAQNFVNSDEFRQVYGSNPTPQSVVSKFYQNILNRPGDQAGINFWVEELTAGRSTLADVLMGFSESPENKQVVGQSIPNGFFLA